MRKRFLTSLFLGFILAIYSGFISRAGSGLLNIPSMYTIKGFPLHFMQPVMLGELIFKPYNLIADIIIYIIFIYCIAAILYSGVYYKSWRMLYVFLILILPVYFIFISILNVARGNIYEGSFLILFISALLGFLLNLFLKINILKYIFYKKFWYSIQTCGYTAVIFGILGSVAKTEEFAVSLLAGLLILAVNSSLKKFYLSDDKKHSTVFLSTAGYVIFGVSLGLIVVSSMYNLVYTPGWFDFRDLGFAFISIPLIMFLNFHPNTDSITARAILYLIAFLNLIIISYAFDFIFYLATKAYKKAFVKDPNPKPIQ